VGRVDLSALVPGYFFPGFAIGILAQAEWKVIVRNHVALLAIVAFITFAAAQAAASTPAPGLVGAKNSSESATQAKLPKTIPAPASTPDSSPRGNTFQVNDEKGLLLTCIAPQIKANPDTDIFNSCTLAPGRTLDDVMHTFIGALHVVQNEQMKERAEWYKSLEDQSDQKSTQK
jgi:hypothetical protein